jgi:CheY-like chemotaxis protein
VASSPRPGSLASRLGQSSTIIVIEDEPDIATFLGAFFRASGTEVVHLNPTTAGVVVDTAVETAAACALVDLNLDGISGFDILEAIRVDPRTAMLPAVIVTADSRPATRERAVSLGASAFVPKPFNVKDLFATVRALVEGDPLLPEQTDTSKANRATVRRSALRGGILPSDVLQHQIGTAIDGARRDHVPVALALIRVIGTAAGQQAVTAELASKLDGSIKGAEVLGASAPDELAVLFPAEGAASAHAQLEAALGASAVEIDLPAGRRVSVAWAAGVAGCPEHATTGDELYMAADAALADAVESGQPVATAR